MGDRTGASCPTCLGKTEPWSFDKHCEVHDVCVTCGIKRKDLTDTPWGVRIGSFKCKPCELSERQKRVAERQKKEIDHEYTDEVICPTCGYEHSDSWEMSSSEYECPECEEKFELEINQSVTYSTRKSP